MMPNTIQISGGIYLVADAVFDFKLLKKKLGEALSSGIRIVQLYNTEKESSLSFSDINEICYLCHVYNVPVLVNNNWRLLNETLIDGVHFDAIPDNIQRIERDAGRQFYKGITINNDLSVVKWANNHQFDYISFCSMFESKTAETCEIVSFESVKKAREITNIPIFLAGGIYPDNINQLRELPFNGIAVISGIMASPDIPSATNNYITELNKIATYENRNH
jgi:thiamine-phosphate pyrophosphorylase